MDDLNDLLAGLNALDDLLADGLGFDAVDEIASDLEIDIGFEQGEADVAEGIADIFFGDLAQTAQVAKSVLELGA
jgi:hypothetical protein